MEKKIISKTLRFLRRKPRISGVNCNWIKMIYYRICLAKDKKVFIKSVNTFVNEYVTAATNKIIKNLNPFFEELEAFLGKMNIDERYPARNTIVIAKKNEYNSTIKDLLIAYKSYIERIESIACKRIVNVLKHSEEIELYEAVVIANFIKRLEKFNEIMEEN